MNQTAYLSAKDVVFLLKKHGIFVTDDTVRLWMTNGLINEKQPSRRNRLGCLKIGGRLFTQLNMLKQFMPKVPFD